MYELLKCLPLLRFIFVRNNHLRSSWNTAFFSQLTDKYIKRRIYFENTYIDKKKEELL